MTLLARGGPRGRSPAATRAGTLPWRSMHAALRNAATVMAFAIAPLAVTGVVAYGLVGHGFAFDFSNQFWPAGRRVLVGLSPYDLGWQDIEHHIAFPYGAVAALLFVPFALLPLGLADAVFVGALLASVPLMLRLLDVRDWRVYGITFLWMPVLEAWGYANVSLLLGLGLALMWRHRDLPLVAGLLFALLVSVKLFVWPLAIWLLGTRRYAALGYAALCGAVLNLVAWAVIGFDQLGPYVKLLGLVAGHAETHESTLRWVIVHFGASRPAAYGLIFALAFGIGACCFVLARRGREQSALMLCVAVTFLATPITWPHYWVLLIVPLALLRAQLGVLWALPVVMGPVAVLMHSMGAIAPAVLLQNATVAAVVLGALRPRVAGASVARRVAA